MTVTLLVAAFAAHLVLRATCAGPAAPRAVMSVTCGVIAAGVVAFLALIG